MSQWYKGEILEYDEKSTANFFGQLGWLEGFKKLLGLPTYPRVWPAVLVGDSAALPVLLELVNDDCPDVRHRAVRGISMIGPDAAPAVPALLEAMMKASKGSALNDDEAWMVYEVRVALYYIDPNAYPPPPPFVP